MKNAKKTPVRQDARVKLSMGTGRISMRESRKPSACVVTTY